MSLTTFSNAIFITPAAYAVSVIKIMTKIGEIHRRDLCYQWITQDYTDGIFHQWSSKENTPATFAVSDLLEKIHWRYMLPVYSQEEHRRQMPLVCFTKRHTGSICYRYIPGMITNNKCRQCVSLRDIPMKYVIGIFSQEYHRRHMSPVYFLWKITDSICSRRLSISMFPMAKAIENL